MSPLQKIAMGLALLAAPSGFQIGDYVWDALPDPLGWLLILAGVRGLRGHLDVSTLVPLTWTAFAVSVVQWIPPVFERLLPADQVAEASIKWAFFLPQALFCLVLVRLIGTAGLEQEPPDRYVAGRFGVLLWAAGALILLPAIAFGTQNDDLVDPTLITIGLVPWVFIYYLFRVHRRTWLGGPGPFEVHPPRNDESRPPR
ncbi:hypothetical protein EFK50_20630 [Nocardioides marmoriginsengisoli]|uniref:Uncharacterized protein n=1 Tax=Nocardioides marmoriginsengisoli TaxID=661483 RepID=A0A3N0CB88_9ACTN|nr:hypothetical protein [Nocardioides marmoriginsengisoli]RNL60714.1 hypothetical protein EFK50_20630 [Nocardioides marmoriginsengisoli]